MRHMLALLLFFLRSISKMSYGNTSNVIEEILNHGYLMNLLSCCSSSRIDCEPYMLEMLQCT